MDEIWEQIAESYNLRYGEIQDKCDRNFLIDSACFYAVMGKKYNHYFVIPLFNNAVSSLLELHNIPIHECRKFQEIFSLEISESENPFDSIDLSKCDLYLKIDF